MMPCGAAAAAAPTVSKAVAIADPPNLGFANPPGAPTKMHVDDTLVVGAATHRVREGITAHTGMPTNRLGRLDYLDRLDTLDARERRERLQLKREEQEVEDAHRAMQLTTDMQLTTHAVAAAAAASIISQALQMDDANAIDSLLLQVLELAEGSVASASAEWATQTEVPGETSSKTGYPCTVS